ncbi:MAG: SDR family NAD(P)-dependent oxidoreductase [Bacteriovoracia bacterium]
MKFNFALITGASSGIGLHFAHELAKQGTNLVLVARREDILQSLAREFAEKYSIQTWTLKADLNLAGEARRIRQFCEEKQIPVDLLINNAGKGLWGDFTDKNLTENLATMDLNMRSLTELTGEMFPLLKKRPSGVINIASTAAFQAIPTFAVYAATKSYVLSFTRALHHEWKPFGIHVTAVCPGGTNTSFMSEAQMGHLMPVTHKFLMSPERVVKASLLAVKKNQIEVVPGVLNWLGSKLARFSPRCLTEMLLGKIFRQSQKTVA